MIKSSFFFVLFSFLTIGIFAQPIKIKLPTKTKIVYDTLTVYDTIFVTDTVRLLKHKGEARVLENLPILPIFQEKKQNNEENSDFLILNKDFAATFSSNSILISDNKNNLFTTQKSDKMKKLSFLGVVFFAFQHMVVAQNNFSLSVGTGYHQVAVERYAPQINPIYDGSSLYKTTPVALFKLGLNMERPIFKGVCSVFNSLNYAWLGKTDYMPFPNATDPLPNLYAQAYRMNHHFLVGLEVCASIRPT